MRAQLYEPEMTLNGGALATLDPLPTPAAERALLAAVEALYAARVLPAGLEPVSVSQGYGTMPEQSDLVAFAVWHHFRRRQRWTAARTFFARLGAHCPAAAVWEAAALRAAGREEGVCELLRSALERSPSSPALLSALAAEYMRVQQIEAAAKLARRAVQLQPRCRPAWLIIARCYAAEGRFAEALVSLNAVPTPPLPRDERELLLVVPPLEPERVTAPQVGPGGVCASSRKAHRERGQSETHGCGKTVGTWHLNLQGAVPTAHHHTTAHLAGNPNPPGAGVPPRPGGGACAGPGGVRQHRRVAAPGLPSGRGTPQPRAGGRGALA